MMKASGTEPATEESTELMSTPNETPTVPAPSPERTSEPPRLDLELASYERYRDAILAESARLFGVPSLF